MGVSASRTFVRRRGTTPLPNATVHDDRLSYAALGLLAVILARPERAPQGYRALVGRGLGEKATQEALRELDAAGYRHQFRSSAGRGALRTDTVISEDPITRDEAEAWLNGGPMAPLIRAAAGAARTDQDERGKTPGHYVRRDTRRDGSRRDETPHRTTSSKVTSSLRSESPEIPSACEHGRAAWQRCPECPADVECEHGTPRRYAACVQCRPAPWDMPRPLPIDSRSRAAGQHLEET